MDALLSLWETKRRGAVGGGESGSVSGRAGEAGGGGVGLMSRGVGNVERVVGGWQ